jgi:hypothetical protein
VEQRIGVRDIAPVFDVVTEVPQRLHNPCRAQHGRSHRGAGHARPRFHRRAEEGDRPWKGQSRPAAVPGDRFRAQDVSFRTKQRQAVLRAFIAPNEAKISPCETKRNGKPLKSLDPKSRDFAESFVFKGLIGFSFRRFRQRAPTASVMRFSSRFLRGQHHNR